MGAEHNDKGLKAQALTISEIPHSISSKHIFGEKVFTGFLLILVFQKSFY